MRNSIIATAICFTLVGLTHGQDSSASIRKPANIAAQPLGAALQALAKEHDFQLVYVSEELANLRTPGAVGEFNLQEVLTRLLSGTGMTFRFLDEKTITVFPLHSSSTLTPRDGGNTSQSDDLWLSQNGGLFAALDEEGALRAGTNRGPLPLADATGRTFWGRFRLASAAGAGDESADAPDDKLEEVVVFGKDFVGAINSSGTKTDTPPLETPMSLSVISRDLLDSWNAGKMTEALRYTPGINAEPWGLEPRFTSVSMRGFEAAAAGIFRDGLALINPGWTVSYNLEPYGAERVEVPRGPASVLYGQGSPGGLVNLVSKMPKDKPFGEVGLEVGNHNRKEGEFDFGAPVGDAFAYRIVGLVRDSDTQVDFIPDDRKYFAASGRWRLSDVTTLTFLTSGQDDHAKDSQALPADGMLSANPNGEVDVGRFTGEPDIDDYRRKEWSVGYQFEHKFNDTVRFFQNMRYNDVELTEIVVYSNGLEPDRRTVTRNAHWAYGQLGGLTVDSQLHLTGTLGGTRHKLLFGVDYQDVSADAVWHWNPTATGLDIFDPVYGADMPRPDAYRDEEISLDQLGFYAQDEIKFNEKLIVNLGVRYDDATSDTFSRLSQSEIQRQQDGELSLRAGMVYLFDNGFAPYASYAESFLPASGTDINGNPFEPELGRQYEVGVKFQPKSFNGLFTAALFDLTRDHYVDRDDAFVYFQVGKGRSRGLELEGFAAMDNGLSYIASYSYLDTKQEDSQRPAIIGNEFPQIPDHKAALWVDYNFKHFGFEDFGVGFGARYQSSSFANDTNDPGFESPGFTLLDAAAHYQWRNMRFGLNLQNLTNKEYAASCFERNSVLCTVGETRAIRATMKYRW
jgi:iron complex outermembrane receptor protein